jgi:hypothetical protein
MDRKARRAGARALAKTQEKLRKASASLPGGSTEHPLLVNSASVIEVRAADTRCFVCDSPRKIREHRALTEGERRLRAVTLLCTRCGDVQTLYFEIQLPN